jgi:hypothetical protein
MDSSFPKVAMKQPSDLPAVEIGYDERDSLCLRESEFNSWWKD